MFQSRVLFILGAGASSEAGLPTGTNLKKDIASRLNVDLEKFRTGDLEIWGALLRHIGQANPNRHLASARQIAAAMPLANSIDAFIDNHRDDERIELCGKLAIVRSIMDAERKSRLYGDLFVQSVELDKPNFADITDTWFVKFFQILHDGVAKADIGSLFDHVSFINFNYDRCVEQFLVKAILVLYGITEDEAQELVGRLKIFHPYGTIGQLHWQGGTVTVPFGHQEMHPDVLLKLSRGIRTYTERVKEADTLATMRQEVAQADIIVFLGFAFHKQNMELITPTSPVEQKYRRVYATAKGISEPDCEIVEDQIENMLNAIQKQPSWNIYMRNELTCAKLFDAYWRTFSMG